MADTLVMPFRNVDLHDLPAAGGKSANLGELSCYLLAAAARVPDEYANLIGGAALPCSPPTATRTSRRTCSTSKIPGSCG